MVMDCERAKRLLDSYHDRQLGGRKFDNVSEHLRDCDSCAAELESLQRLSRALKERYADAAAGEVDFSRVWAGVDGVIGAREERPVESLLERFVAALSIPRPAWAVVAAAAVVIVMIFASMPGDRQTPVMAANDCVIDSVDYSQDYSVMLYEIGDSHMKVIWVMDQQPEQDSPGENT